MEEDTTVVKRVAIDLAKHVFQAAGEDRHGQVVWETRYRSRDAFWRFVQEVKPPLEVLMESGPGAQCWARELQRRGVDVRVLPAQRVAEHRSGAKNDRNDARAILRAGRDQSIHAVPVKTIERLTMQALHRVRSGHLRRRTAISNQIRGLLLEHGIAIAPGDHALSAKLGRVLEDGALPLPDRLRELLAELWCEWQALSRRADSLSAELATAATADPLAQRLMTIPGVGPVTASALVCKDLHIERFASARQFAAYFGLVPDQHSSGSRIRLGKMSRRGDGYIRSLAIQGAHAVLRHVPPDSTEGAHQRLTRWKQRHGSKGAAVRLANRNLRLVWALMNHQRDYCLEVATH